MPIRVLERVGWTNLPQGACYNFPLFVDHLLPVASGIGLVPFQLTTRCILERCLASCRTCTVDGAEELEEGLAGILVGKPLALYELVEIGSRDNFQQLERHVEDVTDLEGWEGRGGRGGEGRRRGGGGTGEGRTGCWDKCCRPRREVRRRVIGRTGSRYHGS